MYSYMAVVFDSVREYLSKYTSINFKNCYFPFTHEKIESVEVTTLALQVQSWDSNWVCLTLSIYSGHKWLAMQGCSFYRQ
jgi:hypothetical protein